jgi:sugar lactone lactonase YvrE
MKVPNIKFQGNMSNGSRDDICVQTDGRIWTNMTKVIVAFREPTHKLHTQKYSYTYSTSCTYIQFTATRTDQSGAIA